MFEEKNSLPGPELHFPVRDWDDFARASQDRANMRRAVVRAFGGMFEPWRALGHELLEKFLQIMTRARVGIFHDDEAATGMPDEDGDGAADKAARFDGRGHLIRNFVSSFAFGRNLESRRGSVHHHVTLEAATGPRNAARRKAARRGRENSVGRDSVEPERRYAAGAVLPPARQSLALPRNLTVRARLVVAGVADPGPLAALCVCSFPDFPLGAQETAGVSDPGYNDLLQIVNFDQGDAGAVVAPAHNCGVGCGHERDGEGRFQIVGRRKRVLDLQRLGGSLAKMERR